MANWAYVENNTVIEHRDLLPSSWKNISGLDKSSNDLDYLRTLGWLPVIKQHQTFNADEYYISGYNFNLNNDNTAVIESITVAKKETPPPAPVIPQARPDETLLSVDELLQKIREERNKRLRDCDWTQLPDAQINMLESDKQKWLVYRQRLRELPNEYSISPVGFYSMVLWPEVV